MQELKAWFNKTSSDRSWDYRTTVLRANGTHQSPGPGPTDVSSVISQADLSLTFIFRSDCTLQQSPMKSGSRTPSGHGLPQGGRHLKSNRTYKKKSKITRKSTCHWFTLFKVPSWIHTLSFSKGKFTKTVNTKQSVTASSLYTMNFTSLSILGFCHKPTAHLSLQSTTTWNQWSLQRTTGQAGLYRKIEIPLNQCHNHPNLNLYPGASEIHCQASSPQSMRLLSLNTEDDKSDFRGEMQPHWMQKIVLTTFIKEPPSLHVPMEEVLVTPNTTRSKAAERGSSTAP